MQAITLLMLRLGCANIDMFAYPSLRPDTATVWMKSPARPSYVLTRVCLRMSMRACIRWAQYYALRPSPSTLHCYVLLRAYCAQLRTLTLCICISFTLPSIHPQHHPPAIYQPWTRRSITQASKLACCASERSSPLTPVSSYPV